MNGEEYNIEESLSFEEFSNIIQEDDVSSSGESEHSQARFEGNLRESEHSRFGTQEGQREGNKELLKKADNNDGAKREEEEEKEEKREEDSDDEEPISRINVRGKRRGKQKCPYKRGGVSTGAIFLQIVVGDFYG